MTERVAKVSEYCQAFFDWRDALEAEGTMPDVVAALDSLYIPIMKSNYLARRLYGGEEHRTEKCPTHKGHWSGCKPEPCIEGCSSGLNVTGWLPSRHPFEAKSFAPGVFEGGISEHLSQTVKEFEDRWRYDPTKHCQHCGGYEQALVHKDYET